MSAALLLVEPAVEKVAALSLSLAETLGPQTPAWAPAAGQEGPGLELLGRWQQI